MVSPGIINPVVSALNAEASGEGVALGAPGASGAGVSGVSGGVNDQEHVQEERIEPEHASAHDMIMKLLTARNIRLGRVMSQSEFDATIAESLVDWEAAKDLLTPAGSQQPPVISTAEQGLRRSGTGVNR